jgi:hypothetical protein
VIRERKRTAASERSWAISERRPLESTQVDPFPETVARHNITFHGERTVADGE